ncbi:hypothetical protein GGS23DRAFT_592594 [Durotheca rogersii]|uniref:uncharacterized protein n=1 Tax=Durotheca rogersii TaxID=419775 RepID=UPI00221F9723|nr:uncharacterized protein GGS23DRAFT_592594 [Durotheca rogersii]KAI5867261.1 hypothetical protein GGS23DRAFT_592594 [Durotheca rogersii]
MREDDPLEALRELFPGRHSLQAFMDWVYEQVREAAPETLTRDKFVVDIDNAQFFDLGFLNSMLRSTNARLFGLEATADQNLASQLSPCILAFQSHEKLDFVFFWLGKLEHTPYTDTVVNAIRRWDETGFYVVARVGQSGKMDGVLPSVRCLPRMTIWVKLPMWKIPGDCCRHHLGSLIAWRNGSFAHAWVEVSGNWEMDGITMNLAIYHDILADAAQALTTDINLFIREGLHIPQRLISEDLLTAARYYSITSIQASLQQLNQQSSWPVSLAKERTSEDTTFAAMMPATNRLRGRIDDAGWNFIWPSPSSVVPSASLYQCLYRTLLERAGLASVRDIGNCQASIEDCHVAAMGMRERV